MELYFPPGNGHQQQRISDEGRKDLAWWAEVLSGAPERSIANHARETIFVWTDAASSRGLGAFYTTNTQPMPQLESPFSIVLPTSQTHAREHINILEMRAVEQAILYWVKVWRSKRVVIHIDNRAVAHGLGNGTIRGASMQVLRRCCLLTAVHDLALETQWISTKENALADALSRLDTQRITDMAPELIYPTCNLQQRGLLTFSNWNSQPRQPTISGGDLHLQHGVTTTNQGPDSPSFVPYLTCSTTVADASQPGPHG